MKILPAPTALSQPYWDGARQHKLLFQKCSKCGTRWHPPMPLCPSCHSGEYTWEPSAGMGAVYTWTVVEHPTHPAFNDKLPYVVAVVELDEGPRIVANIRECEPYAVKGGMRVQLLFEDVTESVTLPQFKPA